MRIKEISIQRYGPLANQLFSALENFTLIYGPNEAGKSLTVEAVVKLFFDKARDIKKIIESSKDRVDQKPEGYVLIEKDGNDFKLPEHGTLFDLLEISAEDCRNVFVVRASELGLSDEKSFYDSVTRKLLGLETEKINKVAEELKRIGKLSNPSSLSELSDAASDGKPRSTIQKALSLKARIIELEKRAIEQAWDSKERLLVTFQERQTLLKTHIADQEAAREREQYLKGKKSLDKVINCVRSLEGLRNFTEEEKKEWENADKKITELLAAIESLENEIEKTRSKQNEIERQVSAMENELNDQQQREGRIEALELACTEYGREQIKSTQAQTESQTLRNYSYASLFAFLIASVVFILRGGLIWTILAGLAFLFFLVVAIRFWLRVAFPAGRVSAKFEQLKQDATRCGFPIGSSFEDILKQIELYKSSFKSKQDQLQRMRTELGIVEGDLTRKESELNRNREELTRLQTTIESIRSRSGVTQLSHYAAKLSEKNRLQGELSQSESALNALWTISENDLNKKIQFWNEKVEGLKSYEHASPGIGYDEALLRQHKEQLQQSENDIDVAKESLEEWQRELSEIAKEVTDVVRFAEQRSAGLIGDRFIRKYYSFPDLRILKTALETFESSVNEKAQEARAAISILEKIRGEEDKKVVSLFGDVTRASEFFNQITDGRYVGILFDAADGKLRVKNNAGEQIESSKLSSGTFDQLYLAIRLSLAEKILGEKGFFILDDPFIRSDPARLRNQLRILKNLAAKGWQFIYFSAKGEVRELFEVEIGRRSANLIDLSNQ